jgi:hypothetical protein
VGLDAIGGAPHGVRAFVLIVSGHDAHKLELKMSLENLEKQP